jgi:hypothetical protein
MKRLIEMGRIPFKKRLHQPKGEKSMLGVYYRLFRNHLLLLKNGFSHYETTFFPTFHACKKLIKRMIESSANPVLKGSARKNIVEKFIRIFT